MPEVIVAKTAGFCFGVSRAVNMVFDETKKGDRVWTCGPIVHNETVIRELEEKGVCALESEADFDKVSGGAVVIRAHGIPEKIENRLRERGIDVVDATCPFLWMMMCSVHASSPVTLSESGFSRRCRKAITTLSTMAPQSVRAGSGQTSMTSTAIGASTISALKGILI